MVYVYLMIRRKRKTTYYSNTYGSLEPNESTLERRRKRRRKVFMAALILIEAVVVFAIIGLVIRHQRIGREQEAAYQAYRETAEALPLISITESLPDNPTADEYWGELIHAPRAIAHERLNVHGIYMNTGLNLEEELDLISRTELNAVVINLKEGDGVYFNSQNELANSVGGNYMRLSVDLPEIIRQCHERGVWVIGRIVCFKDPMLAEAYPERALRDANGTVLHFNTESRMAFLDPYNSDNWDYCIDLALEAIEMGVDEIQFDYVRFPTGSTMEGTVPTYREAEGIPTTYDAINRFLQTARIRIQDTYGVPVSGDVFGISLTSRNDGELIGQDWPTIGFTGVDSICPMVYPSHYALGTTLNGVEFPTPDTHPYEVMYNALAVGREFHEQEGYAVVRPYVQAFTASYIGEGNYMVYDYEAINDQICALQDAGLDEFILWSPNPNYPEGQYSGNAELAEGERPGETAQGREEETETETETAAGEGAADNEGAAADEAVTEGGTADET